ncbi:MAG: hypothetical protein NC307_04130 [Roseburia sp.]|nr:hypothetical protein [Roseburia sp.]
MKDKKTFINPDTSKEWWVEVEDYHIKSCLNNGKIKEFTYINDYDVRNKTSQIIMEKMRKGFIYQNANAAFGEVKSYQFVGRAYNGFMPIAASLSREDFFITRIVGDFVDEILYHFDGNGNWIEKQSLGAKRMTYSQVLCADQMILMNNSHLIEQFSLKNREITPLPSQKDSLQSMLDAKEEIALWYTGEEIVVYDFKNHKEVWSEKVKCQETKEAFAGYYHEGLLSPSQTKAAYRTQKNGYVLVDLKSGQKIFIENKEWHPFFSPDDQYFSVGGRFYLCETGEEIHNPFPFEIKQNLTYYNTCTVKTNGKLLAVQQGIRNEPIEIWDYNSGKLLTIIEDLLTVQKVCFEFTKSNLVLHTDYGAVSVYNCTWP